MEKKRETVAFLLLTTLLEIHSRASYPWSAPPATRDFLIDFPQPKRQIEQKSFKKYWLFCHKLTLP